MIKDIFSHFLHWNIFQYIQLITCAEIKDAVHISVSTNVQLCQFIRKIRFSKLLFQIKMKYIICHTYLK